jgi:hypothetical protein
MSSYINGEISDNVPQKKSSCPAKVEIYVKACGTSLLTFGAFHIIFVIFNFQLQMTEE